MLGCCMCGAATCVISWPLRARSTSHGYVSYKQQALASIPHIHTTIHIVALEFCQPWVCFAINSKPWQAYPGRPAMRLLAPHTRDTDSHMRRFIALAYAELLLARLVCKLVSAWCALASPHSCSQDKLCTSIEHPRAPPPYSPAYTPLTLLHILALLCSTLSPLSAHACCMRAVTRATGSH